jgi:hypothetical protein
VESTCATQPGVRRESASTLAMSEPVAAAKPAWRAKVRRLVDQGDAGKAERDLAGAVGGGVVDDDDLGLAGGQRTGLGKNRLKAGRKVGLFVVCGDDEAKTHSHIM